jgi:catechol 2,3-dioxygenase-like lactoylglutathione lyase family enzyme
MIEQLTVPASRLVLGGVHHTARPTWKLKETIVFYRDLLGLPLVHAVSARGWGPADHPDFLHFFFDSGNGSTIAFFYYIGTTQPSHLVHHAKYDSDATHTAWRVESADDLAGWRGWLERNGIEVMFQIQHEIVESIYFRDPNGYLLEIGRPTRMLTDLDAREAEMTLAAAIALEEAGTLTTIDAVWREKGTAVARVLADAGAPR